MGKPRLVFWPKAVFQLPSTETTALKWLFHREKATLHKAGKAARIGRPLPFGAMRWLMIALLVSVGAMLFAAAGVARHIWLQRTRLHSNPDARAGHQPATSVAHKRAGEADPEVEL
jgi:hypothetical protein